MVLNTEFEPLLPACALAPPAPTVTVYAVLKATAVVVDVR
jgi:hypothetical protein